jgi:predicted nucleic acid-binding protein
VTPDSGDEIVLESTLAAKADYIATYDKDLLDLDRPFGIETVRPAEFLRRIKA